MSDGIPELPSVLVVGGPLDGHEVKLNPGLSLIVGSGRLANLRLDHPEIELAHIKVVWDELGLSMVDNGSRHGTWVNGEPVETTNLLDGDTIEFSDPNAKKKTSPLAPKIRLKIPKGSVPDPPPPPPPAPGEVAAKAPGRTTTSRSRARRRRGPRLPGVDPKLIALGVGGVAVLLGGYWLVRWLFFTGPSVRALQPARVEMGQELTITGARFDADAGDNQVWFGTVAATPTAATAGSLQVRVPMLSAAGPVAVSVETSAGRSRSLTLTAISPLRVEALDPQGALPGDLVTLRGSGFAEDSSVTVAGQAARVDKVEPQELRFEMPKLEGASGSAHTVVVSAAGRSGPATTILLGRLPLVSAIEPGRGVAGDLVRVKGAGFAGTDTAVLLDGQPALVVAGDKAELVVSVPPSARAQAEALVPVAVQVGGRTSGEGPGFSLMRLVEGTWVPSFMADHAGEGGRAGQATVGTELAPVLLLSAKDESRSVGERALAVARALNAAVDRARVGHPALFEARESPEIAVGIVGRPDVLVRVLAQDAAAYETPPGFPPRGAPPSPGALARHWAALLTDTVAIGTSGAKPRATAELGPQGALAFTRLRAALPWQYGGGVSSARVLALGADVRRGLREAAFRVP